MSSNNLLMMFISAALLITLITLFMSFGTNNEIMSCQKEKKQSEPALCQKTVLSQTRIHNLKQFKNVKSLQNPKLAILIGVKMCYYNHFCLKIDFL